MDTAAASRPACRRDRMAAIRALRLRAGVANRWVVAMRRLLEQLELCGDADGSQARQEVLADRLGISERQLRRWIELAVGEGLVEVVDRWTTNGRRRRTVIDWERVLAGPVSVRETQLFLPFGGVPDGQDVRSQPDAVSGCNREDLGSSEVTPLPTLPESPAAEPAGSEELRIRGQEWQQVRDLLRDRGVVGVPTLLDGLRARGVEPWAIETVVRFWDANRRGWRTPGALRWRLANLIPGVVPESDWRSRWDETLREWPPASGLSPRPRQAAQERPRTHSGDSASRQSAERVDVRQERDQRRRAWQATAARLERDFGPGWDALSAADQAVVVERLAGPWALERWRRAQAVAEQRRAMRVEVLGLLELESRGRGSECLAR